MKTPIVTILLIANVLMSFLAFQQESIFRKLRFSPMAVLQRREWERVIGHAFIHGSWLHLAVNMLVLYMFGKNVELFFTHQFGMLSGSVLFAVLYFGGLLAASLPSLYKQAENPNYFAVGASGAIAAVLFAHILFRPTATLLVFPIPFPLPSFLVGLLYILYERYMEKRGGDNVAHDAHLWGAVFGVVFTAFAQPSLIPAFFMSVKDYFQAFGA